MSEILYKYDGGRIDFNLANIRWIERNELELFNQHLELCGQKPLAQQIWDDAYDSGTIYCILFADHLPVARACVEKYSSKMWEVADVRVAKACQNRGLAYAVSVFVLNYILDNARVPTIRTESDNQPMLRVIEKNGFSLF